MTQHLLRLSSFFIILVFFVTGCKDGPTDVLTDENSRITINNDPEDLDDRITYYDDQDVPIDTTVVSPRMLSKRAAPFKIKLRAEVIPPTAGGVTLQATHVTLAGSYAYVSYNVAGATYLGGVDVFNVQNKNMPTLVSQAIFTNTDVSALTYDNGKLYLAEATGDTGFTYPAVIEEIVLSNNLLTAQSRRVGISSYVATDVRVAFGKIFASSGSGGPGTGGLTVLDPVMLTEISSDLFLDARAVNAYGSDVAVLQGMPARLRIYDGTGNAFVRSVIIGGANIPESKSTANVVLTRAFVAAGDEGTKIVDLTSDAIVDSLPRVTVSGLDPGLTVTNAVSVNKDLVLMANGEAGVYVAQAAFDLETTSSGDPDITLLGKMQFGTQESANFVASSGDVIFIATGLGGLKILQVNY